MAVTNTQAIKFCNEDIRVAAEMYVQLYNRTLDILARWSANGQNITALIPNDSTVIDDGAEVGHTPQPDGRPPLTGLFLD